MVKPVNSGIDYRSTVLKLDAPTLPLAAHALLVQPILCEQPTGVYHPVRCLSTQKSILSQRSSIGGNHFANVKYCYTLISNLLDLQSKLTLLNPACMYVNTAHMVY